MKTILASLLMVISMVSMAQEINVDFKLMDYNVGEDQLKEPKIQLLESQTESLIELNESLSAIKERGEDLISRYEIPMKSLRKKLNKGNKVIPGLNITIEMGYVTQQHVFRVLCENNPQELKIVEMDNTNFKLGTALRVEMDKCFNAYERVVGKGKLTYYQKETVSTGDLVRDLSSINDDEEINDILKESGSKALEISLKEVYQDK
jgi:hypothetical protein